MTSNLRIWSNEEIDEKNLCNVINFVKELASGFLIKTKEEKNVKSITIFLGRFPLRFDKQFDSNDDISSYHFMGSFSLSEDEDPVYGDEIGSESFILLLARELSKTQKINISFHCLNHGVEEFQFFDGQLVLALGIITSKTKGDTFSFFFRFNGKEDEILTTQDVVLKSIDELIQFQQERPDLSRKLQILIDLVHGLPSDDTEMDFLWQTWEVE